MMNFSFSQIKKIEPPNWWIGMKGDTLQIMFYGLDLGSYTPSVLYSGVKLNEYHIADSPNYIFLDLYISPKTIAGEVEITFSKDEGKSVLKHAYPLFSRDDSDINYVGFDSSDVVYLITPDRFSNGNPNIDFQEGFKEATVDRSQDYARHGGDIKGIINHLDYIYEMGFTAIWPTPLLTNDMQEQSYHGYAMTNFYEVDPRFGSMEDYVLLSRKSRNLGIKLLMDQVVNHCGIEHWWMSDLPFSDWINFQDQFENRNHISVTNHRRTINQDIYASQADKDLMNDGWFVPSMPDLNQNNSFMATYLIQNSIWWIEKLHLGGIRQDTYPYSDKSFMAKWAGAIMQQYPNFNIVGEEWSYNPLLVRYWQQGADNADGYSSNLKTTMDFPLQRTLVTSLKESETLDSGLIKLYEGLANDFAYYDPQSIMLFGDNHDMDRIFTQLGEDLVKTKMAMAFILLAPRIPQIYYGTEILLQNSDKPGDHGLIRSDFPGGWQNDKVSGFTEEGLTKEQKEMQQYLKKILNFRKNNNTIHQGKTIHFAPEDGIYVLFRTLLDEVVILILNKNEKAIDLDLSRFMEINIKGKRFFSLLDDEEVELQTNLRLEHKGCMILYTNSN